MTTKKKELIVTSALPYANGPLHFGHLLEHIQTDIWVRAQRILGNHCIYLCASDAHGTPIMMKAEEENVPPERLVDKYMKEHKKTLEAFQVSHDCYYQTHSEENKKYSELIYNAALKNGFISKKNIKQLFDEEKKLFLADLLQNPKLLAKMLREYGEGKQSTGVYNALKSYLIKNGYVDTPRRIGVATLPEDDFSEEGSLIEDEVKVEQPPVNVTPTPPEVDTNRTIVQSGPPINLSQVTSPAPIPTTQQAQTQMGSPDPNLRTKYASLFPDDPISGMLGTGGITNVRT